MTCDQAQRIADDCLSFTSAERTSAAIHFRACAGCKKVREEKMKEYSANLSYIEILMCHVIAKAMAEDALRKDLKDPEIREMLEKELQSGGTR